MKVNFYATLRAIVGQKTVEIEPLPGMIAQQIVERLVTVYPALRPELLDENNRFQDHMKFFINGREAIYMEDKMNTVIHLDDKVDIFPPIGGG